MIFRLLIFFIIVLISNASAEDKSASGTNDRQNALNEANQAENRIEVVFSGKRKTILSAQVSGEIIKINKFLGEKFAQNDILLAIDNTVYTAMRDKAAAAANAAKVNYDATMDMQKRNDATLVELANASRDLKTAEATLKIAEKELADCQVKAPYAGRIVKVMVEEHQLVQPGFPLMDIVDDTVLLAHFLLPDLMFRHIKIGDKIAVHLVAEEKTIEVTICRIAAGTDPASRTFEVYAEIDNSKGELGYGLTGYFLRNEIMKTDK